MYAVLINLTLVEIGTNCKFLYNQVAEELFTGPYKDFCVEI